MKARKLSLVLLLFLLAASPSFAGTFGWSVAKDGIKTQDMGYGGFSFGLAWEPWEFEWLNPSLTMNVSVETDENDDWKVPAWNIILNVDIIRTMHHPFWFISHNRIAYDPSIGVGINTNPDDDWHVGLILRASPIKFSQPDFWYEALSPFFIYDTDGWTWGIDLLRFTWMFL